ncbi:Layilin [Varanus komodoensis]|nr:Layilin [Varanus komodoensis]
MGLSPPTSEDSLSEGLSTGQILWHVKGTDKSTRRRREQTAVSTKACDSWMSLKSQASSRLEVHNVIQKQSEADLAGTRSEIKNSSFWARASGNTPDDLSGEYDNIAVQTSERGFGALASTESGFVTNDIYELCNDRVGCSKESSWVENEIYGY